MRTTTPEDDWSGLSDFQAAVEAAGLADRVRYLSHGDTYAFEVPAERSVTVAGAEVAPDDAIAP